MRKIISFPGVLIFLIISTTTALAADLEIHVINVGQGDCYLIVSPTGETCLIDAGNNGKGTGTVLPYLSGLGITNLDHIVASRYHADYVGGIDEVVYGLGGSFYITYAVYDRGGSYSSKTYTDYVTAIGGKRTTIYPNDTIDLGSGVSLTCIASDGYTPGGQAYSGSSENTLSVVLILSYHNFQMYFGGDSTSTIEDDLAPYAGDVDVYKVSHHGSDTSSSQTLLNYLKPEVSTISVGDSNSYGHPHIDTIMRLVNMNSYIYQTETGSGTLLPGEGEIANGSFKIETDGYTYEISGSDITPRIYYTDDVSSVDDLLGTWAGQGVYYRNSDTGSWVMMASPATQITAGDIDNDGIDDLIGIWPGQGGVWIKYSSGSWVLLSSTADWIATGDMNGDGRCDLLGTWTGQGVYYRNSANSQWVKLATPATQITAGDLDNDGTDDLIGIWPGQGGVWIKYSGTGSWAFLSSTADWMACGDMNGDGYDDLLGTWIGQGVYYKDSATESWIKIATPATQIAAGDLDGDSVDDLMGIWPGQGGVWVKYSSDETWERQSSTADWIACGKMRGAPDVPADNNIALSISPTSGVNGTFVTATISIRGNLEEISAFGLELTFDSNMFEYVDYSAGSLTQNWGGLAASNPSSGVIQVGGFGGINSIPVGSTGSFISIRLRVACNGCSNGTQSTIRMANLADNIAGMSMSPSSQTFTYTE